jgi:methyl-accepting chemotaxis protein
MGPILHSTSIVINLDPVDGRRNQAGDRVMSELATALDKAIAAHGMWKRRLKSAMNSGQSDVTPQVVAADNNCEFGKWLYGNGVRLSPAEKGTDFEMVKKLHADFHRCASDTLGKALKGDRQGCDCDMGLSGRFSDASAKLTGAMMSWKRRVA